jgi:hypothetical protein
MNEKSYSKMKFNPDKFIFIIHHFKCMRTITVHMTKSIRYTTIRIKKEKLKKHNFQNICFLVETLLDELLEDYSQKSPKPYLDLLNVFPDCVFENE